jgi:UDP-GlcNAc:undecaprenyl-phosphate/decaprenyl-phosphate GlcNAc-1-phosphate transferase
MLLATAFVLALVLSLLLTPIGTRMAWATGYLDKPEARKLHTTATALLGGAVVFVSALIAWGASLRTQAFGFAHEVPYILTGAILVLGIGLWDDRFGMAPRAKFLGQATAAALLLASGHIPDFGLPAIPVAGFDVAVMLNAVLALVSLVALMNAINFLDNMNGVVAGLAAIALGGYAFHSWSLGAHGLAAAQLAVAGACIGFLKYNFPKAKIFLGDAGSLFLGYCLGASALLAYDAAPTGWGKSGAILMLGYPAFDLFFVVITRRREGRKISQGGKDHTNHRIANLIGCQTTTVLLVWLSGVALCASGLVVLRLNQPLPAALSLVLWITLFLLAGLRLSSVPVGTAPRAPS